jgi:DNA-binding transcriptional MerR regulator
MGKIKSAVELAMEKTQGLRLSSEEKEKLKEEEWHSKAHGLVNRFLAADFHLKEVQKELGKYPPEPREHLEKLMLHDLREAIQLDQTNDLIFQGIEALQQKSEKTIKEIRELMEDYRNRKEKEDKQTKKGLLKKLERQGISGSAVQPKVEGSKEWEEALARFKPPFERRLQDLKKELESISRLVKKDGSS